VAAGPEPVEGPIADGSERVLDPRSISLERVSRGIFTAIFAGLSFIALAVVLFSASLGMLIGLLSLAAWALVMAGLAALAWFWPPLHYRHVSYRVDDSGIRIRRGVIWRSVTTVPRSRVQHTDVSQGPIERGLGLASLIIHTAGTQNASVSLGGLSHDDALRVRDHLIDVDERDAV
jgi:membrane protein YdbS with pleckstrin-like domain